MRNTAGRIADVFANEADKANDMVISMENTFRLILTVLIISFGFVFPNGSFASDKHTQEDYDYGIYLISHFFPSLAKNKCNSPDNMNEVVCQELAQDGLVLNEIADSFRTRLYLDGDELRTHLPKVKTLFDCVVTRCARYDQISQIELNLVYRVGDQVLDYLTCLSGIPTKPFWDQAIAAQNYYKRNASQYSLNEDAKRLPLKNELSHFFLKSSTFAECAHLNVSDDTLSFLRKLHPRRSILNRI